MIWIPESSSFALEHGTCAVVRCGGKDLRFEALHPQERRFADALPPRRAPVWLAGRVALREAMRKAGVSCDGPVLSTDRGAPLLPAGVAGSLSHKSVADGTVAAAIVACGANFTLGIDIEHSESAGRDVGKKVLTPDELSKLKRLPPDRREFETILRFSIKEAIYKAADPILRAKLCFQNASVKPLEDGSATIDWRLAPGWNAPPTDARWMVWNGLIIATARSTRQQ